MLTRGVQISEAGCLECSTTSRSTRRSPARTPSSRPRPLDTLDAPCVTALGTTEAVPANGAHGFVHETRRDQAEGPRQTSAPRDAGKTTVQARQHARDQA